MKLGLAMRRDEFLFGEFNEAEYTGGIRYFKDLSPRLLHQLVILKMADNEECQNNGPTIYEFLKFAEECKSNAEITFSGYVISPFRNDGSLVVDKISMKAEQIDPECTIAFMDRFDNADELKSSYNPETKMHILEAWWD